MMTAALGLYREIRRAVHRLKYHGKMSLAVPQETAQLKAGKDDLISVECLVPFRLGAAEMEV